MNQWRSQRTYVSVLLIVTFLVAGCSKEPCIVFPEPRVALKEVGDPKSFPEMPQYAADWPRWERVSEEIKSGTKHVEFLGKRYQLQSDEHAEGASLIPQMSVAVLDFRNIKDRNQRLLVSVRHAPRQEGDFGFLDSMIAEQILVDGSWINHGYQIEHHFDGKHEEHCYKNGKLEGRQICLYPNGRRHVDRFWKDNSMINDLPWVMFNEDGSVFGHYLEEN